MSAGLPSVCTTMIARVCGVIFDSTSDGSRLNDSSDSAMTGRAPFMTIELKQEYQLHAGRITSSPGPTPSAASAVVSAAVPEVTASAILHLHPRGECLLELEGLPRRLASWPVPAERLAALDHVAELGKLLVVIDTPDRSRWHGAACCGRAFPRQPRGLAGHWSIRPGPRQRRETIGDAWKAPRCKMADSDPESSGALDVPYKRFRIFMAALQAAETVHLVVMVVEAGGVLALVGEARARLRSSVAVMST